MEADRYQLEVEVLQRVRRQLRCVGDGLLWKAVGFDRIHAYAVADAPGGGNAFLSAPEGLGAELAVIERLWERKGALGVMHDLTNCGKVGDLTIVSPGETIKVAEVKASGAFDSRQTRRMNGMISLLRGGPKVTEDGHTLYVERPARGPSIRKPGNWRHYHRAITDAAVRGLGWSTVDGYLGVEVVNILHPSWQVTRVAPIDDEERRKLYDRLYEPAHSAMAAALFTGGDDVLMGWDSAEKQELDLPGAPFSVYPLPPDVCAALTCDYMKVVVYLNVTRFYRRLGERGFDVLALPMPSGRRGEDAFFDAYLSRPKIMRDGSKKAIHVHLGKPLMQQLAGEGLSLEDIERAVKEQMRGKVDGKLDVSLHLLNADGSRLIAQAPVS